MADNLNVQISVAAKDLASAPLKQMESSLTSLGRTAESTSGMFGKLTASFASGAGLAAGMAGIQGIAGAFSAVGDSIIGLNANLEQNKIAFTTMLGSGEKAEKMLADLTKLAADTPFELKDLEQGTKRLLAFGFSGDQIMPMLKSLGDAAAGLGMSGSEGLNRLGLALGQMQAKGKVSAQEMMQLAEAGVPAWDILAKGIGKTTAETMNLAEKGLIPANLAIDVLTKGMEERFPDMMAKQSQTFNGLMSTLHDTVTIGLAKMGEPIFNAMKDVLKGVVDLLSGPGLANAMTGIGTMVANAVTFITNGIKTAADFLGPFIAQAQAFAEQTGNQFAVLADLVDQALKGNIVEAIQGFLTYLGSVRDMLVERFAGWASAFLDWIGPMIPKALAQLGAFEVRMATWIIDQVQPFSNNLMKWGAAFVEWIQPRVPAILAALADMGGRLLDWITGTALPGIAARLGQWAQAFTAWVQPLIPPFLSELGNLLQRFGGWLTGTALPFIAAQLGQWAQAFIDWIGPLIPPFIGRLGDLLSQFGGWLTGTALPFISDHLAEWGQAFLDWVGPMIPPLLAEAGKLLGQFGSWIKDTAAPAIADKLGEWAGKFVAWVSPMIPPLLAEVGTLLNRLVTWIKNDAVPAIADGLGYWVGKFIGWVGDVVPKLPGELSKMLTSIKDWITGEGGTGATDSAKTLGANILDGIKNGLENGVGGFFDYLGDLVKRTVQSFLGGFQRGQQAGTQQVGLRIDNDSLPFGAATGAYNPAQVAAYIQQRAPAYGIDPQTALRVAQSEGLNNPVGDAGQSFGPYQLFTGGGLGNGFQRQTGLNPADYQNNWQQQVEFALNWASQNGWNPGGVRTATGATGGGFHGATVAGIGNWDGIGGPVSGGGLQNVNFSVQNAVDTPGGSGPTVAIPDDVAAAWDKAGNKTEKTLAEKVQPTVDQFNKLLQTTRDRLGDIGTNAQKAFDQAADAANKAMAKARETASSQISDLYSNRDIQRSVRARTDEFQAAMDEASRSFQENQQATQQRLRRTSEDQTTVRSRAQEDADRGLSIQLSAQEVAHKRELQDKDAAHQQTVDLTEAAYQRDLDLRKATTADQKKQIQERYAEQVESITHRAQLEQQQRAYQRAEEDAERKRQDELDAAALKRRRDEEDANLAYRRQQEDKANADQSAAQQAAEVFKRQQAAQTRAFQDGLEDEALARQVVRINQERDQRIADIQEEQKQRQAAITEQANQERDRLIRDAQERGAELATRIKEIAGADAGQFLGPLQAQLAALVGEIKGAMGEANAAIASLPDTAAQAASDLAAPNAEIAAQIDVSDQAVELFADKFGLSWDDARKIMQQIEAGATQAFGKVVPKQVSVSDDAVEAFAAQWGVSWDEARATLEAGTRAVQEGTQTQNTAIAGVTTKLGENKDAHTALLNPIGLVKDATKELASGGFDVAKDAATQVSFVLQQLNDKMPELIDRTKEYTDALNAIPKNITVTINQVGAAAGGVSVGGGGGNRGPGSPNLYNPPLPSGGSGGGSSKPDYSYDPGGGNGTVYDDMGSPIVYDTDTYVDDGGSGDNGDSSGDIPEFARGGVVPGPIGKARLAIVHGGEVFAGVNGERNDLLGGYSMPSGGGNTGGGIDYDALAAAIVGALRGAPLVARVDGTQAVTALSDVLQRNGQSRLLAR